MPSPDEMIWPSLMYVGPNASAASRNRRASPAVVCSRSATPPVPCREVPRHRADPSNRRQGAAPASNGGLHRTRRRTTSRLRRHGSASGSSICQGGSSLNAPTVRSVLIVPQSRIGATLPSNGRGVGRLRTACPRVADLMARTVGGVPCTPCWRRSSTSRPSHSARTSRSSSNTHPSATDSCCGPVGDAARAARNRRVDRGHEPGRVHDVDPHAGAQPRHLQRPTLRDARRARAARPTRCAERPRAVSLGRVGRAGRRQPRTSAVRRQRPEVLAVDGPRAQPQPRPLRDGGPTGRDGDAPRPGARVGHLGIWEYLPVEDRLWLSPTMERCSVTSRARSTAVRCCCCRWCLQRCVTR